MSPELQLTAYVSTTRTSSMSQLHITSCLLKAPYEPTLAVNPDGNVVSDLLANELRFFSAIPIGDSACETLHAVGNAIARSSKHCDFSWVASTMRLGQNLKDVRQFQRAVNADLQATWLRFGSILQSDPKRRNINDRVRRKEFTNRVYHMGLMSKPLRAPGQQCEDRLTIDLDVDVPPAGPIAEVAGDDNDDDDPPPEPRYGKGELALMKEYLVRSLKPGMYVSFPVRSDESPGHIAPFFAQVLAIQPKVTFPKMCTHT